MPNRKKANLVIADAERLVKVWSENDQFSMGDLSLEGLKHEIDKLQNLKQSLDLFRVTLSKLIDDTQDQTKLVNGYTNRGRMGMKAVFGPDSAQYAQVGGTRLSQRKPVARKKKANVEQA